MKWARFEADGAIVYGIVEGEEIAEVRGDPFSDYALTGNRQPLAEAKLAVPVIPRTFYAAGLNYAAHVREQAERRGETPNFPPQADIGYRANNALIAHGEPIVIPHDATDQVEYEAELVVVIGKQARRLSEADALSCVLGYTIGNDVSERTWQRSDRTLWRAKNTDSFKPMGPWIETDVNLEDMRTAVRLNGQTTIEFETNAMLFGVAHFISRMSRYLTLYPGDMVWMGTEGKSPQMKDGDVVDIEISGIGVLTSPVIRETAADD